MGDKVSDFLMKRLSAWGIKRIFGYPGDGINGILGGLERHQDLIEFVQVRHEEMAAFMATAHAKFTDEVGVCLATSGPGAIHILNGLYDAKMDHRPVVAIVGQAATTAIGGNYQQEVDLVSLFKDVAGEYVYMASSPVQIRQLIDRAMRIAITERSVTCIIIPKDVQEMDAVEQPPHTANTVHTGLGYSTPRVVPTEDDLKRAADILNAGKKVAILVGIGAKHAADEVIEVADLLGCGVAKALLGKQVLPDDLPFVTGTIGLLGTKPSYDMMMGCDTLLMIGSTFPYGQFLPKEGQARGVQIDIDGRNLSLRYPMELNLIGDSKETLRALIPYLQRKTDRSWREQIEAGYHDWWKVIEARSMESADPLNPQRIFWELSQRLHENIILSGDAGTATNWYGNTIKMRRGMMGSLSGSLATMGPAVPYAIAAKFAYPDRIPIALTGDGAMQMNGLAAMLTVKKYWKQWRDPRLIFMVLNNRDLNQVTWEMRIEAGNPKLPATQDLPDFPYASYADSIGLKGIRVDKPEDVGPAWDAALSADRPVLFEAYVSGDVTTIPPHISFEEAKNYASALLKGDPDEGSIVKESIKSVFEGIIPHKG
nr:thiamine pyrophosphate-requiring protein [Ktedonobacteraceae bacterium]